MLSATSIASILAALLSASPRGPACRTVDTFGAPTEVGRVDSDELDEASGLAAARRTPGVLFVHNDSGDRPRFFALSSKDGALLATFNVSGAQAHDWEDIATGPCPAGSCVFLADTGDNHKKRADYVIYRVTEPAVKAGVTRSLHADAFPIRYPDGQPHNTETLLVHPRTGDLYLLTKKHGVTDVYKLPASTLPNTPTTLEKLGRIQLPDDERATGGAIHPCANRFLLRTYHHVLELRADDAADFDSVFSAVPVELPVPDEEKGEAIEYRPDGQGFWTISEGEHPMLHFTPASFLSRPPEN